MCYRIFQQNKRGTAFLMVTSVEVKDDYQANSVPVKRPARFDNRNTAQYHAKKLEKAAGRRCMVIQSEK